MTRIFSGEFDYKQTITLALLLGEVNGVIYVSIELVFLKEVSDGNLEGNDGYFRRMDIHFVISK